MLRELLQENTEPAVFVLSYGFLETDVERELVTSEGVSVLLMPSPNFEAFLEIVVGRQMNRGLYSDRDFQVKVFTARFEPYMNLADI